MEKQKESVAYEQYVDALPLKAIQIGGCKRMIRLDEAAHKAFLLDNDGVWTGKVASLPETVSVEDTSFACREKGDNSASDSIKPKIFDDVSSVAKEPPPRKEKTKKAKRSFLHHVLLNKLDKKKRTIFFVLLFGTLLLIILSIIFFASLGKSDINDIPAKEMPIVQDDSTVATSNYCILVAKQDIFPGDEINVIDISYLYISPAEYAIACTHSYPYLDKNLDDVLGKFSSSFIPKGCAIFGLTSTPYVPASSPWSSVDDGYSALLIPVVTDANNFSTLIIGNHVKIVISRSVVNSDYNPGEVVVTDGLDHQTTVVQATITDTFTLDKVVLADLIDIEGNSIYALYDKYLKIPTVLRDDIVRNSLNPIGAQAFIPCYVKVIVTQEQKEAIGELTAENTVVEFFPWQYSDGRTSCEDETYQSKFLEINKIVEDTMYYDNQEG